MDIELAQGLSALLYDKCFDQACEVVLSHPPTSIDWTFLRLVCCQLVCERRADPLDQQDPILIQWADDVAMVAVGNLRTKLSNSVRRGDVDRPDLLWNRQRDGEG